MAAVGCLVGALYGGWNFDWAWTLVGHVMGIGVAIRPWMIWGRDNPTPEA